MTDEERETLIGDLRALFRELRVLGYLNGYRPPPDENEAPR
jgi:hypothetical protein